MDKSHIKRIMIELKIAGVTRYGLSKMESQALPAIIHGDEHIGGVVYGKSKVGSVMLIATDKRLIYLDRKPFFNTMDELTYDVVSGVRVDHAGVFSSVVLHTKVADYTLRFVNRKCVKIFANYIESRRLEAGKYNQATGRYEQSVKPSQNTVVGSAGAIKFLKEHSLATFSSVDKNGNVYGAVVYYMVDENFFIYILTKSSTTKGRNVFANSQVALTIHETGTQETLQLQGTAEVETDTQTKQTVFDYVVKQRVYRDKKLLPPITKIDAGSYMVIKISPTNLKYNDYSKL